MKQKLFDAFDQCIEEGMEVPFCACEAIAGYVHVGGRKCQVTVKVEADENDWLDDAAAVSAKHGVEVAV